MTDPTPAPPTSPSQGQTPPPQRKKWLWGVGILGVSLLVGGVFFQLGRSDAHSDEDGHDHAAHGSKPAKSPANAEMLRHSDRAARAAATGDVAKARVELFEAYKLSPRYAPSLLIQACLAMEEGNDGEADNALAALKTIAPRAPELKLLEGLRERRRVAGTSWQQAFRETWVALGRPDFQKSKLLPGGTQLPPDPQEAEALKAAWTRATSDDVKLMLALGSRRLDADMAQFLLKQVPRLEDPALYVAVMDALRGDVLPEASHEEARTVFRQKLEALAAAHPQSMQLQLLLLIGDTEQGSPLSAKEIDALEQVAALPLWREGTFAGTYQEARRLLKEAGAPDTAAMAMTVAMRSVADRGTWVLRTRVVGTRGVMPPEGVKRVGRIARDIGARMAGQPTMMERMAGLQLQRSGAQDMGDEAVRVLTLAQLEALEAAVASFRKTAMERWPLHALTEELLEASLRDEPAYLLSFKAEDAGKTAGAQP
ncbi:hypothetical protein [Pyxidicoccus xibeiensis]|uniref:hypothetical protein n=1 Tax=Pyxidicoccus xibeiensis TaxID=2906759 RepID=UPI0020A7739B|nr:hypothetical protein [Pyxidicoccus xibeiensis]MCP3137059.1 hypothetical protein [Pyxidicoccus xibeiensis]